jgi:hypothetical protein
VVRVITQKEKRIVGRPGAKWIDVNNDMRTVDAANWRIPFTVSKFLWQRATTVIVGHT